MWGKARHLRKLPTLGLNNFAHVNDRNFNPFFFLSSNIHLSIKTKKFFLEKHFHGEYRAQNLLSKLSHLAPT